MNTFTSVILLLVSCVSFAQKVTYKDSVLQVLSTTENLNERATLYGDLAVYYYDREIYPDSAYYYNEQAYSLARTTNSKDNEARALYNFGMIYLQIRSNDEAIEWFSKAKEMYQKLGSKQNLSIVNSSLGYLHFENQDYRSASDYFSNAIAISREIGDTIGVGIDKINLGETLYELGDFQRAKETLLEAIDILKNKNIAVSAAHIYLGQTLLSLKDHKNARLQADIAYELAQKEGNLKYSADAHKLLYDLFKEEGQYDKALEHHEQYTKLRDSLNVAREHSTIEKMRLNFNIARKDKELNYLAQKEKYRAIIYILGALGLIFLVVILVKQRKVAKMTKSIHDIQKRLIESRLPKKE